MYAAGIAKAIDIFTTSAPRIPSIRQEAARWREKRAERRSREEAKRHRANTVLPLQPKMDLSFAPTPLLEPEWILDEISRAWDLFERGSSSRTTSELRSVRVVELDPLTLAANVQPGSHLRGTAVETSHHQLPFPVVVPQRCPGSSRDGFVDVYAPALESCHMGQNAFTRFREGLEVVMRVSTFAKAFTNQALLEHGHLSLDIKFVNDAERFDSKLRRSMVDQYLEEVNRIVFMPKGLVACLFFRPAPTLFDVPKVFEVDLTVLRSGQPLISYDDELKYLSSMELNEAEHTGMRATVAPLVITGLERAAVKACHGDLEELSQLRATYLNRITVLNDYFERRLQAAGVRTAPRGTKRSQIFESVDARPQSFKSQSVERSLRVGVLYLIIRNSNVIGI